MTYHIATDVPHEIEDGNRIAHLTLEDGSGGRFHITTDDHCYVLMCERDGKFIASTHWFYEAVLALLSLPPYPDDAPRPPSLKLVQ